MKVLLSLATLLFAASTTMAAPVEPTQGKAKAKRDPEVIFKRLDADSDGAITKLEWKNSRRAKLHAERAEKAFSRRDKDADGKLTKSEFTAKRTPKPQQ